MLKETKIFFDNLFKIRHNLLTEGVSDNDIVKAIQNYEYIYIYYVAGEEEKIATGYRTVRPYVLGVTTAGNKAVRAWQDKGNSFSLSPQSPRKRKDHEWFIDNDGKEKPGWRLFRLDRITYLYPIGRKFVDKEGKVLIPPLYNEKDKQMISIVASISIPEPTKITTKDIGSIEKPDIEKEKISKTDFEKQKKGGRFKQFIDVVKGRREATTRDIDNLYNIAKKVMKKKPDSYFVAVDNKGDFRLVNKKNKEWFEQNTPDSIIGDLTTLYSKYVLANKKRPEEDSFYNQMKNRLKK